MDVAEFLGGFSHVPFVSTEELLFPPLRSTGLNRIVRAFWLGAML